MGRKYKVLRKEIGALRAEIADLRKLVTGKGPSKPAKKAKAAKKKASAPTKVAPARRIVKSRPLARAPKPRAVTVEESPVVLTEVASLE